MLDIETLLAAIPDSPPCGPNLVERGRPGQDNYLALAVACYDPCVTLRM